MSYLCAVGISICVLYVDLHVLFVGRRYIFMSYVCAVGIWVVLRKQAPMCDIELVALDLHICVANRLVQRTTYTV